MRKLLFALLFITAGCGKDEIPLDPALDIATWQYCQNLPNREITLEKMVGTWKLIGSSCSECSDISIKKAEDNVRIVIGKDTDGPKFTQFFNEVPGVEFDFALIETTRKNSFTMALEKYVLILNTAGTIDICQEDRLAFRNATIEHFYVRMK